MTQPPPLEMRLSLNVLEHLGLNLYSHVPAVLSEAVANAWDADATEVHIDINADAGCIEIRDNGLGMTRDEVQDRFLVMGFRRRDAMPGHTPRGRAPMGRKGIGKLSLFSIAHQVEVHTIRTGASPCAIRMEVEHIRRQIQRDPQGRYLPKEIEPQAELTTHGTCFVLTDLQRRHTIRTMSALRKRLARRFSIIGPQHQFQVFVNGEAITTADRDYYAKLQFLWTYGDQTEVQRMCPDEVRVTGRPDCFGAADNPVSGWIGTVKESRDLKEEQGGDNLNRLAIYVRGKLAQEDVLGQFSERGIYASYLIGELRVDSFDLDDQPDVATSNRQQIVEDDERFQELQAFLQGELKHVQNRWTTWRNQEGVNTALEIPAVKDWMGSLGTEHRRKAEAWIGRVNRIQLDELDDRKQLIKHAILAFEFYRAHDNLARLKHVGDRSLDDVLALFRDLDSLELALYGQIVQHRLAIVRALQAMVEENRIEKDIQKYIFNHLWLLDPHWERIETTAYMESEVGKLFDEIEAGLTDEERRGRIDIGYQSTAGKHIIIELKRPEVRVSVWTLTAQIDKYRSGLAKLLESMGKQQPSIEIVVLLGSHPREWNTPNGHQVVENGLASVGARCVLYRELLEHAYEAYRDYDRKRRNVDELQAIIREIEDYAPA